MSYDLATDPTNPFAESAAALLEKANESLPENPSTASALALMAQSYAELGAAWEARATAYEARTNSFISYLAALPTTTRSEQQHAAQVDKLICTRLGFIPGETNE